MKYVSVCAGIEAATVAQQEAEAYRDSVARLKRAKAPERQETDWLWGSWMR